MNLWELPVSAFTDEVASDSPAPGGGAVAGLQAAVGAALGVMVAQLTQGRKKYEAFAENAAEAEKKLNSLRGRMLAAMEQDCQAFREVSAAFALPRETEEEKARRSEAIQEKLRVCTQTPLNLMALCDEAMAAVTSMLGRCNSTCSSDLGMAALSLKAALQGAWLNVCINITSLKDRAFAEECRKKGEALMARALPAADRCFSEVLKSTGVSGPLATEHP
ncbi:MAG: cyclodeaminase/cyclohydrolase family protein [Fretibacterium sp.]|nr:cyclodeaminase/cyclohydrolase family protein [Fretibacterium sp.]